MSVMIKNWRLKDRQSGGIDTMLAADKCGGNAMLLGPFERPVSIIDDIGPYFEAR